MAIIKVLKRENPYVQIDKIGVDDSNLSWEATGLLTYLIGRPNNWKINIAHLASVKKNKETSKGLPKRKETFEFQSYISETYKIYTQNNGLGLSLETVSSLQSGHKSDSLLSCGL